MCIYHIPVTVTGCGFLEERVNHRGSTSFALQIRILLPERTESSEEAP